MTRPTKITMVPACSHCGEKHQTRVYTDTEQAFHCWDHMGEENAVLVDLLGLTWGYDVCGDILRIGPHHEPYAPFLHGLWETIEQYSTRSPSEIRAVIEKICDALAERNRELAKRARD